MRRARKKIKALERRAEPGETRWYRQVGHLVGSRRREMRQFGYFPRGNWNDYARLVYARFPEFDLLPRPLDLISQVDDLPDDAVFHLHWTRAAQVGTTTRPAAEERTRTFLAPIERFVARGGTLIWTIHEPIDHDVVYPDIDAALRRRLAELAHGIHLLHPSTAGTARSHYPVDAAKTFVVEHPLYTGAHQDVVRRPAARALLDLDEEQVLLLAFGAIRPYKGFERLVAALPRIREASGRDVRLVVAGRALRNLDTTPLQDLVTATPGATMTEEGPPEEAVSILFRATDLAVLPYHHFHNSGVLFLSLTFGVPVVAPRTPVTEELAGSGMVLPFDGASDDDLVATVVRAIAVARPAGEPPADLRDRFDPNRLSGEFAAAVGRILAARSR